MKNLKDLEVWFVTGSQHLYGEETLKQVDKHSKEIALPRCRRGHTGKCHIQTGFKINRRNIRVLPGSKQCKKLYWHYRMDAYIFSGQNVDRRIEDSAKTNAAFAYAIQPRYSLEGN